MRIDEEMSVAFRCKSGGGRLSWGSFKDIDKNGACPLCGSYEHRTDHWVRVAGYWWRYNLFERVVMGERNRFMDLGEVDFVKEAS